MSLVHPLREYPRTSIPDFPCFLGRHVRDGKLKTLNSHGASEVVG